MKVGRWHPHTTSKMLLVRFIGQYRNYNANISSRTVCGAKTFLPTVPIVFDISEYYNSFDKNKSSHDPPERMKPP
jgi:hypothetical protein